LVEQLTVSADNGYVRTRHTLLVKLKTHI